VPPSRHAQIGSLKGCAPHRRPSFSPRSTINPTRTKDADRRQKRSHPPPTITDFKPPIAVAYLNSAGNVVLSRGSTKKIAAACWHRAGPLPRRQEASLRAPPIQRTVPDRIIVLYDFDSGKSVDLVQGLVRQAFWSPDDGRVAFLKGPGSIVAGLVFPRLNARGPPHFFSSQSVNSLHGWVDNHTVLGNGHAKNAYWLSEDNQQTIRGAQRYLRVQHFRS